ncbi:jg15169 [Pararge aegeria aegeria]|uniref:Jg15169 protein n=1 Tax=Pararge aegeria aegeria TaxID=348720 RepID=A0A8S4SHP2_9NEOP|nr:jg15169 [Pararge aegeria aegeria]
MMVAGYIQPDKQHVISLQSLQKPVSGKLDVQLKKLEDFFMTDAISRASPTMAKCVQAVIKQKQSPY